MTVFVNAIMYYKVKDATSAVANVDDYCASARLLAATTLRNILGTKTLGDILAERESIAHDMQVSLDEATDPWGVYIERVEVKDVRVPEQLQRAMAAEAEAAREARAKVGPEGDRSDKPIAQGDSGRGGAQGQQSPQTRRGGYLGITRSAAGIKQVY